jgi:hypothetical protein
MALSCEIVERDRLVSDLKASITSITLINISCRIFVVSLATIPDRFVVVVVNHDGFTNNLL